MHRERTGHEQDADGDVKDENVADASRNCSNVRAFSLS